MILLYDEADALLGKHSQVNDAHDRFANIEIGYLIQKMEEYLCFVILATNLRTNLDDAFLRLLNYVIDFHLTDAENSIKMWENIVCNSQKMMV